ncbi:putative ankyrin repeat protein [Powai lake megavirus]|uniref:Putative ankyrin repeat protein n=1 Tax=Powai lake megavirus TaxID=1842663 RepID=A0A167RPC0_9VIRU|nr:putative ankyrin repeat protein [Powai lake megavirus]ANB50956.1 putative ankyrin repeat protein [Powai lake megavirus]
MDIQDIAPVEIWINIIKNTDDDTISSLLISNKVLISLIELINCRHTLIKIIFNLVKFKHLSILKNILEIKTIPKNRKYRFVDMCYVFAYRFGFIDLLEYLDDYSVKDNCINNDNDDNDNDDDDSDDNDNDDDDNDDDDDDDDHIDYYNGHDKKYDYDYNYNYDHLVEHSYGYVSDIEYAIKYGQLDTIKYLLNNDNKLTRYFYNFRYACKMGNLEIVKYMHQNGWNNHNCIESGLWSACKYNHMNILEFLISCLPENYEKDCETLCSAAESGNIEIVQYLISLGWDVTINKNSAMIRAAQKKDLNMIMYLISIGAKYNSNVLYHSCENIEIVKYLLTPNIEITNKDLNSLGKICKSGFFEALQLLAENDHNNIIKKNAGGLIYHAAEYGHLEIVKYLISIKPKIGKNNCGAIRIAFINCHLDVVKYLVSVGTPVNNINEYAASIICRGSYHYHHPIEKKIECIKWIIEEMGMTHYTKAIAIKAFGYGHAAIIEYLISVGFDINIIDSVALDYVCINDYIECLDILIKHGIDITMNNNRAIKLSAQESSFKVLCKLISLGVNYRIDDDFPMKIAMKQCVMHEYRYYQKIIKYLEKLGVDKDNCRKTFKLVKRIKTVKNPNKTQKEKDSSMKHHNMALNWDKLRGN